jgi:hypothetical protein
MKIDLDNKEFQMALDLIQETNKSFFLTGKAGTGKSTFLKYITENISKNFIVVAPTGIAAVNVGGVTIHSFFQFPLRPLLPEDDDIKVFWKDSEKRKIISSMDTLIIDEISMVRADLIDGIDYSLRRNGGNPELPFGGKQVVFVGDIFQLEPVTIKKSGEQEIINEIYGSVYFYNAKVFERLDLFTLELQKVYRQTDPQFIALLDKVRIKEISQTELDRLNTRVFPELDLKKKELAITLTTRNDIADKVNINKLSELQSPPHKYFAEVSGEFEEGKYPSEPELTLKIGAQVIFVKNDSEKRWVNGTIGKVTDLTETSIKVQIKDETTHIVERRVWENIKYKYNKEKKKIEQEVVGSFKQYPLKLAWAITIHKSQGLTFERVVIDFGDGTFASGHAYVALSRTTSFDGLFHKRRMHFSDIQVDQDIKVFAKTFNNFDIINKNLQNAKEIYGFKKNQNFEQLGNYYFTKAIQSLRNGDFKVTFENLLLGYKNVSCDCWLVGLVEKHDIEIRKAINTATINCALSELDFIRAVYHFYSDSDTFDKKQTGAFKKAILFINSFIESNEFEEIGHYLKGRMLACCEEFEEAISEYETAISLLETPRVRYRLGRLKEQKLNQWGIDDLYKSILLNLSSSCCNRWFKDIADKRGLKLKTNVSKLLANKFNNNNTDEYRKAIILLLKNGSIGLTTGETLIVSEALSDFKSTLIADKQIFVLDEFSNNETEDNDYDDYSDYDDYDDGYGSRYEKYGGYNGYDDDTIDDAFEGDPMNTWNVD